MHDLKYYVTANFYATELQ